MDEPAPFFWPNLAAFESWINRNCHNCRWRSGGPNGPCPDAACPVPKLGLNAMIHNWPTPIQVIGIACNPALHRNTIALTGAPYKCYHRSDKRGRPRRTSNY